MGLDETAFPYIDLFSAEFAADRDAVYEAALAQSPIAKCQFGYMLLGDQVIRDLLHDERIVVPGRRLGEVFGIQDGPFLQWFSRLIICLDGPEHSRLRRLVSRSFSAKQSDLVRPTARAMLDELLDDVVERGECEFVGEVAQKFPIRVLCRMLGVPEEDVPKFTGWVMSLAHLVEMDLLSHIDELDHAISSLTAYGSELIERRAALADKPDDLLQSLIDAAEEGERLTMDELRSLLIALLVGGLDTTMNALSWGVILFSGHPGLWDGMAEDPAMIPRAVEELLRFRPPNQTSPRIVDEDLEYDGLSVPAQTILLVSWAAGNRDGCPRSDPGTFDVTRDPNSLTFGFGPHYCLGAHLARAQLQEAFRILTGRLRSVRIEGEPDIGGPIGVHKVACLPLRFERRSDGPAQNFETEPVRAGLSLEEPRGII